MWSKAVRPLIILGDGLAKGTLRLFGVEITRSWTSADSDEASSAPRSRTELKRRLSALLRDGPVAPDRRREIERALEIDELRLRGAMVERADMTCLDLAESLDSNLETIAASPHVRFPVLDSGGGGAEFAGVVYLQDLLADPQRLRTGELDLQGIVRPETRVSPDERLSRLIDHLQQEGHEIALVEEDGRVIGMVTITDALEAIVGELHDPLDRPGAQPGSGLGVGGPSRGLGRGGSSGGGQPTSSAPPSMR